MKNREILLVDPMALHRAMWVSFLRNWAKTNHASVVSVSPIALPLAVSEDTCFALIILNVNGASVCAPETLAWLDLLSKKMSGVPVVIMSNRDTDAEVVTAFRAGVQGFVPSSIEPEIALQALSYIMGGGSFFPSGPVLNRSEPEPCELPRAILVQGIDTLASAVVSIKARHRPPSM